MTELTFDQSLALSIYQSAEAFPVDLDDAWQWLGWSSKQKALQCLSENFDSDTDFLTLGKKVANGGRPSKSIVLSVDCFKHLAMMSGTEQGKAIRKYFLECERIAKASTVKSQPSLTDNGIATQITQLSQAKLELQQRIDAHERVIKQLKSDLQEAENKHTKLSLEFVNQHRELGETFVACQEQIAIATRANKYILFTSKKD
jgi:phage anti-repressor protein